MSDHSVEAEFDMLLRRGGIDVPAEWRAGTLASFVDLRRQAELLHAPRDPEDEPAMTYRMKPWTTRD